MIYYIYSNKYLNTERNKMPAPYSNDLRIKVIEAVNKKELTQKSIAEIFGVSTYFITTLLERYKKTGDIKPKPMGIHIKPKITPLGEEHILECLANEPDLTLNELCDKYEAHFNIKVGKSSMDRALKRMEVTFKKKSPYDPEKESPRVEKLKQEYCEEIKDIPADKIYFIDEMGAGLNLIPNYGRSPSNERVYDTKPVSKGQRISLIGAMTKSGMKTALNVEGTTNMLVFIYFITHFLSPLLKKGDYVVVDNASIHKSDEIKELIEACGATLIYLPPYHPELNPIELVWNKIKTRLRKERARTKEQLYDIYSKALKTITSDNTNKFFCKSMEFVT
jgi:transposase